MSTKKNNINYPTKNIKKKYIYDQEKNEMVNQNLGIKKTTVIQLDKSKIRNGKINDDKNSNNGYKKNVNKSLTNNKSVIHSELNKLNSSYSRTVSKTLKTQETKNSNQLDLNKLRSNYSTSNSQVVTKKVTNNPKLSRQINVNTKVTKKKVNRINKKNVIIFLLIIGILILGVIYFFIIKSPIDSLTHNDNDYISQSELDKYDLLSKTLTFYKKEYKERYIEYEKIHPELDLETIIIYVNIGLDREFYTNVKDIDDGYSNFVLVNKFYKLGSTFVPKNLEQINSKYTSGKKLMESNARIAFEAMANDARSEGYTIRAVSTYRSYDYQKNLYSRYVSSDGVEKADTYSARAGYSEHQTGLAVDVDNEKVSYTNFGNTKEFTWMLNNAYKYGFILRYTKENEFITGYKNEPWHYRYVGIEIATYIQNHPMTYEEYYVRFLEK